MACEDHFHRELRQRGLRLTPQRELVLTTLHEAKAPVQAEELYERILAGAHMQAPPAPDLSTVYRTLSLLMELQLVTSVEASDGLRRYELLGLHGPHLHLACRRCGSVEGLPPEAAQALVDELRLQFGFEVDVTQLVVPGVCQRCRAEQGELSASQEVGQRIEVEGGV